MCRTVLIFNVHCEHQHAEIQKCSDIIASEEKHNNSFFVKKLFSTPKNCQRPQKTVNYTKAQLCPTCIGRGLTYEKIRAQRDNAARRPPRPSFQPEPRRNTGNPNPSPYLMTGALPADDRRNVQFDGYAPRLPNVRATAIYRDSQDLAPDTLRQYLGTPGVAFDAPHNTAFQRPPIAPSQHPRNRSSSRARPRSRSRERRGGSTAQRSSAYDNRSTQPPPPRARASSHSTARPSYLDRPLPPAPLLPSPLLQPQRYASVTSHQPTIHHPLPHSRVHSVLLAQNGNEFRPQPTPFPQPSMLPQPFPQRSNSTSGPAYYRGRPTDLELNRMDRAVDEAERVWRAAGSNPSTRPQRHRSDSMTSARNHRHQRDGKYA